MKNETKKFEVRIKSNGEALVDCDTLEEAYAEVEELENEDHKNGLLEPAYYEIYDLKNDEII